MKKILSILLTVTMIFSLVAAFRTPTASAQSVTKALDYLPYGWTIFTANGPTNPGTNPVVHGKTEAKYIYYTMGDTIQGKGGTPGGQIALVGYGPDSTFGTGDDVIISFAPVAGGGSFAIATSPVPQDGAYAIRDYTGNVLGAVLVSNIYIRYIFSIDQKSLTYNCSDQLISGFVRRGDGTGAGYNPTITPAGQFAPYMTHVHIIYPDGSDVFASVQAYGQFSFMVTVNQKGVYRVYVEDNYGDPANPGNGSTEFGFVYAELPTGKLSITLSTYVEPTYLYDNTTYQQEVVLRAVDQDGDAVTGATFSILDGFVSWTATEIDEGIYKVVGKKDSTKGIASFQITSTVGGSALYSNVMSIPFKAITNFNPVVSVDVDNSKAPYKYTTSTISEWAYDKLPCTVGESLVIKPGLFDVKSGYEIEEAYAEVEGPVYMIDDTTTYQYATWSNNKIPNLAASNIITVVGDPYFQSFNASSLYPNQVKGTGGLVYDGFYSGADWYYVAPRYLVTGPGTITVKVTQTNWKKVDPNEEIGPYNACCDPHEEVFKICDTVGCDVNVAPTSMTVGTASDIKVTITSKGLACGCNVIVHVVPYSGTSEFFTLADGTKVDDLWFNISGSVTLPHGIVPKGSTPGASSDVTGTVTFPSVTANYCDYVKVEVFTVVTPSGCSATPVWVFAYVNPVAIYAGISSQKLTYEIVGQTGDNNYLVAGVPDTVTINGFHPLAKLYYLRMDLAGDGSLRYNTDDTYSAQDNGDGTYTIQLTPFPRVFGWVRPTSIRIALRMIDADEKGCKLVGYVDIPVKMPDFSTAITTSCGDSFENDNIITEGFIEKLTLASINDPRTGKDLLIDELKATVASDSCYIPTAWVDFYPCEGCSSTTIAIAALDNPNIDAKPVVRPYVTLNGVKVRLYGAELTVKSPTISVTPNKDIPFTSPGLPITYLTFSAIDGHEKPMCGRVFSIFDINTFTDYYAFTGPYEGESIYLCDTDVSGIPFKPSFYTHMQIDDGMMFALTTGSAYMRHTAVTGSDGITVYAFGPDYSGRYGASIEPDVKSAPKAPLKAFVAKMKLVFETVPQLPVVDTEKPVVTITAPAGGSTVNTPTVKITGTATDNVGVVSVFVGTKMADFNSSTGEFSAVVDLVVGDNTFTVTASDAALTPNVGKATVKVTYAVPKVTVVKVQIGSDIMTVNGNAVQIDAPAEIKNGRTFLPLRAISEALGATVDWIAETQGITVTLGDNSIGLQIGNTSAVVNGTVMTLDAAPYIKNSRTMVPFRVIAESLGATVEWDPVSRVVTITM